MLKSIVTNSMSKALMTIPHLRLTKLSTIKFSQDMATDLTVALSAMVPFLARQTRITKCKITQTINVLTVPVGWNKLPLQKKPTEKSPLEVKPSMKTPNPRKETPHIKPTEIQESYTVNGKTFDNRYDAENIVMNSTLKTLTIILYHRLIKSSTTKFIRIMATVTDTLAVMVPSPTQQMPIKKCKTIQTTGALTVLVGWIKSRSKKKMTKP